MKETIRISTTAQTPTISVSDYLPKSHLPTKINETASYQQPTPRQTHAFINSTSHPTPVSPVSRNELNFIPFPGLTWLDLAYPGLLLTYLRLPLLSASVHYLSKSLAHVRHLRVRVLGIVLCSAFLRFGAGSMVQCRRCLSRVGFGLASG
ncbi:hypothetical protein P153DRAFT_69701 [Dothidotthia symphoricarpi CBS 119687]|uniref:Uncharacterized protein n=1 Tax=Dothidotthia symphoricarpi CBS 119687 TaxID=1392245 RepID=A0A6A6A4N7_9PLEO|nr:uncharacterized protein P153DRAFT_69701 [Dothidotthia symphoricarpi CBS 119687]KAF2126770.1 hypothetical protein P153DRAFT_69701 [Dothidotthia symphoricarpi CBS 119687]